MNEYEITCRVVTGYGKFEAVYNVNAPNLLDAIYKVYEDTQLEWMDKFGVIKATAICK